ncbi:CxxC motif-containing protein (DUF1111 family) [Bisgaardia hudsonensis]|uniref:CxxC motif-containing protein (DUF1111 family) n=1 Tax=Bisgaardia hudsonensis TaxID=109472 RepID=A0A4R2N081_9PAST|nr:di-heme oxidoredictase family protein [Bisgaardia hudsonensis]QLB13398.1 hypothetical protein A6A11_07145 [Bisgaardia hudsonensis]TCP12802.1 CxxC motif-containing protein (DUF1111 family) [Bisgaardia hudsonensis]
MIPITNTLSTRFIISTILFSISSYCFASNSIFENRTILPSHKPISGLTDTEQDTFMLGRSFFSIPWVASPSATTARDGLGPLFNANACIACHSEKHHKSKISNNSYIQRTLVFKLSQPSKHHLRPKNTSTMPDPVYGPQIAINATGTIPFEAKPDILWHNHQEKLTDGTIIELRRPEGKLTELNYGRLDPDTKISLRIAPLLIGLGLLAKIPDKDIISTAEKQKKTASLVKGKVQWVYNPYHKKREIGRFGYKAAQSSIRMQTADAAVNDMGLTNPFFPTETCTKIQVDCLNATPSRNSPQGRLDLPLVRLNAIAFYLENIKSPANIKDNPKYSKGKNIFENIGCAECHQPMQKTKDNIVFYPYTDMLLHDMGKELSDNRPEFEATPQDWRTAALWGIGAKVREGFLLLHDGRARNLTEAILWHSGESESSTEKFKQLSKEDRQALLEFVESL